MTLRLELLPLIVTNCAILGRAEAFASKNNVFASIIDGIMMGLGFALILILLGAFREIIGEGTLFNNMQLLFGDSASDWKIVIFEDYVNVLFMILPPGAFIGLGLIVALKNLVDMNLKARADRHKTDVISGSKRVRVTGNIS